MPPAWITAQLIGLLYLLLNVPPAAVVLWHASRGERSRWWALGVLVGSQWVLIAYAAQVLLGGRAQRA